jgi:hypothetical protein
VEEEYALGVLIVFAGLREKKCSSRLLGQGKEKIQ